MVVKRILLLIILCFAFNVSFAQIADQEVIYKLGSIYSGDVKLTSDQVADLMTDDMYTDYLSGRRLYKSGVIVTSVGAGVVAASGLLFGSMFLPSKTTDNETPGMPLGTALISLGGAITGGAIIAVGVPLLCVGNNRLKNTVEGYNIRNVSLTLGPTRYGAGLSFTF